MLRIAVAPVQEQSLDVRSGRGRKERVHQFEALLIQGMRFRGASHSCENLCLDREVARREIEFLRKLRVRTNGFIHTR